MLSWGLVPAAIVLELDEGEKMSEIQWGHRPVWDAGRVMEHMMVASKWWTEEMEEVWEQKQNEYVGWA